MSIKYTSDCNGCADCIGCSLGKKRKAVFCDECGQEIAERVYPIGNQHICEDCLPDMVRSVWADALTGEDDYGEL